MKTVLICHEGDSLNEVGLARWLGSFSDVAGIVVIHETRQRMWRRIRREIGRVGLARFPDVLAFRVYYRLMHAPRDRRWEDRRLAELCNRYPSLDSSVRTLHTTSPNSSDVVEFMRQSEPDIVIARCKTLLKETVFSIPRLGTFVMHPGICPEYRNAHGCFWALANGDYDRVGMTLLRVDKGVDTGSVYGYYTCNLDNAPQSHIVIQHRVVFDNLDALRAKFEEIDSGRARTIDTTGRQSATWGQPWLTRQLRIEWKGRHLPTTISREARGSSN